jgi:hypothetical protein
MYAEDWSVNVQLGSVDDLWVGNDAVSSPISESEVV